MPNYKYVEYATVYICALVLSPLLCIIICQWH